MFIAKFFSLFLLSLFFGNSTNFSPVIYAPISQQDQLTQENYNKNEITEISKLIRQHVPLWVKMWEKAVPGFNLANFRKITEEKFIPDVEGQFDFTNEISEEDQLRKLFYVYSPDKTKFIDSHLDAALSLENNQLSVGFEPDHGVMLYDINNKLEQRLIYCGTSCKFDDAFWINNDTAAVVGISEYFPDESEKVLSSNNVTLYVPTLDIFDFQKNIQKHYEGQKTSLEMLENYFFLKFPQVSGS